MMHSKYLTKTNYSNVMTTGVGNWHILVSYLATEKNVIFMMFSIKYLFNLSNSILD